MQQSDKMRGTALFCLALVRSVAALSKAFDPKFTQVRHPLIPDKVLSVKPVPESLGIDNVTQYTGYISVTKTGDRKLFFWFFESRSSPSTDPVVVWLNGGPGCSSLEGLFVENGPASINDKLQPVHNPWSWNGAANMLYIDQPAGVGFARNYDEKPVFTTDEAASEFVDFMMLFMLRFPQYAKQNLHISGESYAGHYVPTFAAALKNTSLMSFRLASIFYGNGLTDPLHQYQGYQPMACGEGGYPSVLSDAACKQMKDRLPYCVDAIKQCYKDRSEGNCSYAYDLCNDAEFNPYFTHTKLNAYDIRGPCPFKGDHGVSCYEKEYWMSQYLSQEHVQESIGVTDHRPFTACNMTINMDFTNVGDWMQPSQQHVTDLLDSGIAVLVYSGVLDYSVNWIGSKLFTDNLEWHGSSGYQSAPTRDWRTSTGELAGDVRNFDKLTFLRVYDAGHEVPLYQPKHSYDMLVQWLRANYAFE